MMTNGRVAMSFILNLLAYNSALHVLESSGYYSSEIAKMPRLLSHPGQCFPGLALEYLLWRGTFDPSDSGC